MGALYARNSAEWVNAYFATLTYDAVTEPFLPDFIPSAVAEAGITQADLQGRIEAEVFELNAKLPTYSKITACELMAEPFEKTPKLSIKRFMYK